MALQLTGKTITDPLYGNINLTEVESRLVSTRVFQRLHNVRQLGLGHMVFPSAGYSRFSHSIGACYNADRILTAICANQEEVRFSDRQRQAFRIAALFHDLGHYPFSHTTEHAVKRFFKQGVYRAANSNQQELGLEMIDQIPQYLDHEDAGQLIFADDPEIKDIIDNSSDISRDDITSIFIDENLSTIISSDLDCDRLDYLKRTALHSGAPYGAVDVDFIISKSTVDKQGRFCFDRKAVRAADHLLVSRFYDFMQIPYHKTVAALEWSLEEAVIYLLQERQLKLSESEMRGRILSGDWASFDDGSMVSLMRAAYETSESDDVANDHLGAVLHRMPAKMIYNWECLVDFSNGELEAKEKLLKMTIAAVAGKMGLDERRFTIWKAPFKLSKAGPILQGSPNDRDYSDEEEQQLIHVLEKGAEKSVPLIDLQSAVSHHLAKLRYRVLRVYYLPSKSDPQTIKNDLRRELSNI